MTRKELFATVKQQVFDPKNAHLLEAEKDSRKLGILWHLNRAENMLASIEESEGNTKELCEQTFDTSIHIILKKLKKQF